MHLPDCWISGQLVLTAKWEKGLCEDDKVEQLEGKYKGELRDQKWGVDAAQDSAMALWRTIMSESAIISTCRCSSANFLKPTPLRSGFHFCRPKCGQARPNLKAKKKNTGLLVCVCLFGKGPICPHTYACGCVYMPGVI